MKVETKRTFYLTKAEKKVLTDFYWNFYGVDEEEICVDAWNVLGKLAKNNPAFDLYEIKITD